MVRYFLSNIRQHSGSLRDLGQHHGTRQIHQPLERSIPLTASRLDMAPLHRLHSDSMPHLAEEIGGKLGEIGTWKLGNFTVQVWNPIEALRCKDNRHPPSPQGSHLPIRKGFLHKTWWHFPRDPPYPISRSVNLGVHPKWGVPCGHRRQFHCAPQAGNIFISINFGFKICHFEMRLTPPFQWALRIWNLKFKGKLQS